MSEEEYMRSSEPLTPGKTKETTYFVDFMN